MASASPRVIASPDCAEAPESAATWPMRMGSAAHAVDAESDEATSAATANRCRLHAFSRWVHIILSCLTHLACRDDRRCSRRCQLNRDANTALLAIRLVTPR